MILDPGRPKIINPIFFWFYGLEFWSPSHILQDFIKKIILNILYYFSSKMLFINFVTCRTDFRSPVSWRGSSLSLGKQSSEILKAFFDFQNDRYKNFMENF